MTETDTQETLELTKRLTTEVLAPLKAAFVGKDEIIDLLGVALVGGENLFLLGPPGTAKSAIVQELSRRIDGRVFDYLLTRFTEPNELFGPFDIRKLREGDLVTNTEGMLPEASFVFLDELLNANSAILNSLLIILNERVLIGFVTHQLLPNTLLGTRINRLGGLVDFEIDVELLAAQRELTEAIGVAKPESVTWRCSTATNNSSSMSRPCRPPPRVTFATTPAFLLIRITRDNCAVTRAKTSEVFETSEVCRAR